MPAPTNPLSAPFAALLAPGDAAAVEAKLGELLERARERWPGVGLGDGSFAQSLADRLPRGEAALTALSGLCAEDCFLAAACAAGDPAALGHFERRILPEARAALLARRLRPDEVEEALQQLRGRLFVGESGPGKIADYAGRAPLAAWVRMAAVRTALNLNRGARRAEVGLDEAPAHALSVPVAPPEFAYVKARYRGQFKAGFEEAFAALEPRQRTLLKLQLVDGLTTTQIGRAYRVDASTVRRWLIDARGRLLEGTRTRLSARLGLADGEVESLLALLVTQLDQSVRRILAEHAPAE